MRGAILRDTSDDSSEDDASRVSNTSSKGRRTRGERASVPATWAVVLSVTILVGVLLLSLWQTEHFPEFRDDLVKCAPTALVALALLVPVAACAMRQQQAVLQETIHEEVSIAMADLQLIIPKVLTAFYDDADRRRELEELGTNLIKNSLQHAYDKAWEEITQAPHKVNNEIQKTVLTAYESKLQRGTSSIVQNPRPKSSAEGSASREQPLAASKFEQLKESPFPREASSDKVLSDFSSMMFSHDTTQDSCLHKFTGSIVFKLISMSIILLNAVYLAYIVDFGVQNSYRRLQGQVPSSPPLGQLPEGCFEIWFAVEISLRMAAEKCDFFTGADWHWNIFDLFLVLESLFSYKWNLSFLRVLRVFRLVRLLRLVRSAWALRRLKTMIFSIMYSFYDVLWAGCAIFLIVLVFGLFFCLAAEDYYNGVDRKDVDQMADASQVNDYFGSVSESVISLWSAVSGGNDWMTYGEVIRTMPAGNLLFSVFVFYVFFCCVGLFNVVTGVFVDSAIECRTADEVVEGYLNELRETADGIKKFFEEADKDCSGTLTRKEFEEHMQHPDVQAYFAGLHIPPEEANTLFSIMDFERTGSIDIDDFVNGTMRLRGKASKVDLIALMYDNSKQSRKLDALCDLLEEELAVLNATLPTRGQPVFEHASPIAVDGMLKHSANGL